MIIRRKSVDAVTEKQILVGMIISTTFLRDVVPMLDLNYFKNTFTKRVATWVTDYFKRYEKAPQKAIQDMFNVERASLVEDEATLIEKLLTDLSNRYSYTGAVNEAYLLDTSTRYFRERELEITADNVKGWLARGELEKAEEALSHHRKVAKLTSEWINPLDEAVIKRTMENTEIDFFTFPGQLGKFLGPMDRGWLVGITGPFKRGKTWFLQEFSVVAMLSRLRVVFFSLEMTDNQMCGRWYKRLIASDENEVEMVYPVFDCKLNQNDSCVKPERKNHIRLLDSNGLKPAYSSALAYKTCDYCRMNDPPSYQPEVWATTLSKELLTQELVSKEMKKFRKMYNRYTRFRVYPRFSASVSDLQHDLRVLEYTEGFVPDVIVVDYADILKSDSELEGTQKEDDVWMNLARMAGEQRALVVTGTQATRQALSTISLKQQHTARWIGKLGHVDSMLTLNQTEEEKEGGIMRIGIMAHRHRDFFEEKHCIVLQKLKFGQANLDSFMGKIE